MTHIKQLVVTYSTWSALNRDAPSLSQGLFVKTHETSATAVAQFEQLDVQLVLPEDSEVDDVQVRADVVSVMPGQALAMQWRPESRDAVEKLLAVVAKHPASPGGDGEPVVDVAEEHHDAPFADRESLQAQVEAMSIQEKRQAALHGRKEMRWLLIKDNNKSVHPFVIKNPAVGIDEIEQFARLTAVNPEVLHTIAHNKDWTRSTNVCRNLVKNPKTPMPDALMLLDKLPLGEVRALAKSGSVRTAIQMAARKRVNS